MFLSPQSPIKKTILPSDTMLVLLVHPAFFLNVNCISSQNYLLNYLVAMEVKRADPFRYLENEALILRDNFYSKLERHRKIYLLPFQTFL